MEDETLDLERFIEELGKQHDELRVNLHLAKAEAREEFERLEKRLDHVRGCLAEIVRETGKLSKDVEHAACLVLEDVRIGYQRIRDLA